MVGIFGFTQAEYYCNNYQGRSGAAARSLRELLEDFRKRRIAALKEGRPEFDDYRDCSLRDSERRLFLSASNYRRSLDLMHTSAASWAHITLYYSSFFAASALLELFGCYVGEKFVIEATKLSPGSQELVLNWQALARLGVHRSGPHVQFWRVFYECSPSFGPFVNDSELKTALDPIQGNERWQIDTRNKVNYDTYKSIDVMSRLQASFDLNQFPRCLQGELSTQHSTSHAMLRLAFSFAKQFGLSTDALGLLTPSGSRSHKVQELILGAAVPDMTGTITWKHIL